MKVRQGFVSNSSSSSFVVIAKPGVIKEMLKKEDKITKKVCGEYFHGSDIIELDGNKYELFQFTVSTDDIGCDCGLGDDYEKAYDKWLEFTDKLGKTEGVIIRDTGC